jgi:hypothetical protein
MLSACIIIYASVAKWAFIKHSPYPSMRSPKWNAKIDVILLIDFCPMEFTMRKENKPGTFNSILIWYMV